MDLKLYEIEKPTEYRLKYVSPLVPTPPFRWILTGSSGSGKTTLIKNILFSKQFGYRDYFDEFYVFLGSMDDVIEISHLSKKEKMDDKICITNTYDDSKVKQLIKDIEETEMKKVNKSRSLFILDDCICQGISQRCKMNSIDEIFIRGRHLNISCIISTQKYKQLNQNTRLLNATHISVFQSTQSIDLEAIATEHSGVRSKDEMMEIFRDNLQQRYSFITISTRDNVIKDKRFITIN